MQKQNQKNETQQNEALTRLAEEIRSLYKDIARNEEFSLTSGKSALETAIKAGHKLLAAKEVVPHGQFTKWVEENTEDSIRTAQRYMRVAKASDLSLLSDCETITDADRVIGQRKQLKSASVNPDDENTENGSGEKTSPATPKENELDGEDDSYEEKLQQARRVFADTVADIVGEQNLVSWKLSCVRISRNGNVVIGTDGKGELLLQTLAIESGKRTFKKLNRNDEITLKTYVVLTAIIKLFHQHNQTGVASEHGGIHRKPVLLLTERAGTETYLAE